MKKRLFIYTVACACMLVCWSQTIGDFNEERLKMNKKGMLVLGSWAIANIAMSPVLASRSTGSTKYFHQMNGYWNSVNLVIGGIGYYTALKTDPAAFTLSETIKEQHKLEKILLFNAGLDLAYIAGGFYLKERAKSTSGNTERLKGFGQSLILQGGFLFAFDLAFYLIQNKHGSILTKYVDQLAMGPGGFSMRWYF